MLFRLRLFGGASIEGPAGPLTGRAVQRRRLAFLALLAMARWRGLTRDRIIAYLWPDADPERARHLLSDSVYRINQALGGDAVLATGDDLRLNPGRLSSDAWEFADAIEQEEWERAASLYAAPFLDGFFVPDAGEFDRWADSERERHRREHARALEALALAAESMSNDAAAVRWWRKLAAADPFSSRVALHLMRALERTGDRAAAVQCSRNHSVLVRTELGVDPDPELLRMEERLRTTESPGLRPVQSPDRSASASSGPQRLPARAPDVGGASGEDNDPTEDVASAHIRRPEPPADSKDSDRGTVFDENRVPAGVGRATDADAGDTDVIRSDHAFSTAPPIAPTPAAPRYRRGHRPSAVALGTLLLAATVAIAWQVRRSRTDVTTVPEVTSIAVLPFEDLSPNHDQEYFTDGITEELLVRLSRIEGFHVVGRTSSFAFKDRDVDVKEVAARLGVSVLLGGSVLKSGDRLRIFAQLIDATNGYQLWSERYEREQEDIFAVQDEIARAIVTRMRGRLPGANVALTPTLTVPTDDPEAYNLYLRGRFEWHKRTEQGLRNAAAYLRQATDRAPNYARALAGLGDAYAVLGFYDYLPPDDAFPAAAEAATRALEIDPDLAEPHATLGYVALYYDWEWERAETEFRRAIELDPGYSTAHQWHANYLTAMGRFDDAIHAMRIAQDLDPLSRIANAALGWVLYYAGDYRGAIEQLHRTLELDARFELAHLWRGLAYEQLGRPAEALTELQHAVEMSGGSAISNASLARTFAIAGDTAAARALLNHLVERRSDGYVPSFEIAKIYEALGDRENTFRWLDRAYAERSHSMAFLAVDPQLARLEMDPAFQRLLRQVGLVGRPVPRRR